MADLGTVFDAVRLGMAPLRFGAGLKGKVLDSLAAGLPCVMTPVAAEGFALPPALRALVGRDAAEFAAIVLRLHADETEHRRAAASGRRLVRREYSGAAVLFGLRDALAPAATHAASA